jgi:hypothetical protein
MLRLLSLAYRRYRGKRSRGENGNHDRAHQKMLPETSKPSDIMQSEASNPMQENIAMTFNGRVSV